MEIGWGLNGYALPNNLLDLASIDLSPVYGAEDETAG
jgi:hypothetical protein